MVQRSGLPDSHGTGHHQVLMAMKIETQKVRSEELREGDKHEDVQSKEKHRQEGRHA